MKELRCPWTALDLFFPLPSLSSTLKNWNPFIILKKNHSHVQAEDTALQFCVVISPKGVCDPLEKVINLYP